MKNRMITIVGAGGLVGSTLAKHLLSSNQGWKVRGLQRSKNAQLQEMNGGFEFKELNLLDPSGFDEAIDGSDVLVISVAAANGQENLVEHLGAVNLAKRAETLGVERIIYIFLVFQHPMQKNGSKAAGRNALQKRNCLNSQFPSIFLGLHG